MLMFKPWPKAIYLGLPYQFCYSLPWEYHDAGQRESFKLGAIYVTSWGPAMKELSALYS